MIRTRFAPSPTGPLHLGHAYSAILAHDFAKARNGQFLVRIEDIDRNRARPKWENRIFDDLKWLGLTWANSIIRQSERSFLYEKVINKLWAMGLLYPCKCSRKDISDSALAPQGFSDANYGPDGLVYPGTCRQQKIFAERPLNSALRLNMAKAVTKCVDIKECNVEITGLKKDNGIISTSQFIDSIGDIVLSRRNKEVAYHLAVVVDDAAQGVSHVIRGSDLKPATNIHVLLQNLLGYSSPAYIHHKLIRDADGKRLAKRDDAKSISSFRSQGATPADIRSLVGL